MNFETLIKGFQKWSLETVGSLESFSRRTWCNFGLDKSFSFANLMQFFERKDLNKKYEDRFKNRNPATKEPHAYTQAEINLIYGTHKSFVARHKTRLQHYRDDCAQKKYFTADAVLIGYERFLAERTGSEKRR